MDGGQFRLYGRMIVLAGLLAAVLVFFFEQKTEGQEVRFLNLPYGDHRQQVLDVYAPSVQPGVKLPVIVYVHGGGWSKGSKSNVAEKPSFFMNNGYVFVSVGYRLFPNVAYNEMAGDVAAAVKWVYDHTDQYPIDRTKIHLMGHSAGGHLVTLVGTDPKYLDSMGLSQNSIKSIVNLEGPLTISQFVRKFPKYREVFGENQAVWAEASPVTYAQQQNLPPMFLASHLDSSLTDYLKKIRDAGNTAEYFECKTLTHHEVTQLIGSRQASTEAKNLTNAVSQFFNKYN